jgi:hypothetical protein
VVTTDATARAKFRWYWAKFSPGIALIRWLSLGPVRRDAERRASEHNRVRVASMLPLHAAGEDRPSAG